MLDTPNQKKPHPVDVQVGRNIRRARTVRGMSQESLADGLEITFQQVQKYEKGSNRVSASKLLGIAGILGVSIETLFDGTGDIPAMELPQVEMTKSEAKLLRYFRALKSPGLQAAAVRVLSAMANDTAVDAEEV